MHVSLKHARRVVLGVAVGALLLAAAPGSGQAEILTLCISPSAQKVVLPLGGTCNKPNRLITWDSYGVVGPSGPLGSQGSARTAGTDRHCRSAGTPGTCGTGRRDRDAWKLWRDRSDRHAGEMGQQGPQGPTGPTGATGPTGPTGASGVNGINGTQFYTLGGGNFGSNVALLFGYTSVLGGPSGPSGATNPPCTTPLAAIARFTTDRATALTRNSIA